MGFDNVDEQHPHLKGGFKKHFCSPEEKEARKAKWKAFMALSPEEREAKIVERRECFKEKFAHLSPEQQQSIQEKFKAFFAEHHPKKHFSGFVGGDAPALA